MEIIYLFSSAIVLIYSCTVMALLLDVPIRTLSPSNNIIFWGGLSFITIASTFISTKISMSDFAALYPLLVQLPVFIIFYIVSKQGYLRVFFVILTTIFLVFPIRILTKIFLESGIINNLFTMGLLVFVSYVLLSLFLYYFVKPSFNYALKNLSNASILKFCTVPILYNIAAYYIGDYMTNSDTLSIRILFFLITLAAYFLLMDIFHSSMEKQRLEYEKDIISLEIETAKQNLRDIKSSQDQAIIFRHDMRHHFSLISSYLDTNEVQKALNYIKGAQSNIEAITPSEFCENETVNLILSSFKSRADKAGVTLSIDVKLPNYLPFDETLLCTLFSNIIENALNASNNVDESDFKVVKVQSMIRRQLLLILVENVYSGEITFENNLPQQYLENHGIGTRSITSIVNKYHGDCFFEATGGTFTTRIMLPMKSQTNVQ